MNISTRSAWRPVLSALVLAAFAFAQPAMARQAASAPAAGKPRIAIRSIAATPAVTLQAKADGSENALAQIEQFAKAGILQIQLLDLTRSQGLLCQLGAIGGVGLFDRLGASHRL